MELVEGAPEDSQAIADASRYFCPFPGCKRSFAELWRLKVHYRAPPDIRGSGKERGHGTELTHCPKCGKGLKPGKHHVGCSGGKAAPRQAKRQRQAAAANNVAAQDGMPGDMQAMYGNCMVMPAAYGQGMPAGMQPNGYGAAYGQQYAPFPQQQPYQPDMSGAYYQGQPHLMAGGVMQQQPQMEQQQQQQQGIHSPTLGVGLGHDQLKGAGSATLQGGTGDMMLGNPQGYQYQQQPMPLQQQPLMQMQQQPQEQQPLMQMQQPQEPQELMQPHHGAMQSQPAMDMLDSSHLQQPQQQQVMIQQPQIKQEPVNVSVGHTVSTASGAYLAQQQHQAMQQQQQLMQQQQQQAMQQPQQAMPHQQMLLPQDSSGLARDQAAAGLMPPPPPVHMGHVQHAPIEAVHPQQQQQQQQHMQQPQQQPQQLLPPAPVQPPSPPPRSQLPPGAPGAAISSSLFDEIDSRSGAGGPPPREHTRPPSPPPLPPDFPQAAGAGTLFNFSQFSQKLPAAQGPSQQMAMMPRGMEQELPPSMDDLWTPEATYDHHSEGDLMQLLFGAPEQPPTMATIHLHHFLEDDACSSPLLTGLVDGSMDDLRAAEAKAGGAAAAGASVAAYAVAAAAPAHPAAPPGANEAAASAVVTAVAADSKPLLHASTAGMMLPTAALPLEPPPQQQHGMYHQYQLQHHPQQQQQQQLQPGVNGVIHSQCGASATIQVQLHMQMHGGDAAASATPGMVQLGGEDARMLQKAVPSMPGAVASRAT